MDLGHRARHKGEPGDLTPPGGRCGGGNSFGRTWSSGPGLPSLPEAHALVPESAVTPVSSFRLMLLLVHGYGVRPWAPPWRGSRRLPGARGTLYLLPAAELGVWLAALSTMPKFGNTGQPVIDDLTAAIGRALTGRVLSRADLAAEVERSTGSAMFGEWLRGSWGSYLKAASFRGLVCFAPSAGTQVRFTAPATWLRGPVTGPAPAEAEPFGRLPAWAREQLQDEAERLAVFLGCALATYSVASRRAGHSGSAWASSW